MIPHIIKYPLLTKKKRMAFLPFKHILEWMRNKEHLTSKGLPEIMSIRASMNKGISSENFHYFSSKWKVIPVPKPVMHLIKPSSISLDGLVGFTDAEGCFFIHIRVNRNKTG